MDELSARVLSSSEKELADRPVASNELLSKAVVVSFCFWRSGMLVNSMLFYNLGYVLGE